MNLTKPSLTDNFSLPAWNGNSTTTENAINSYVLQDNKTVYVATTGSDTTGDGTSSKPYATIQKAADTTPKNLNSFNANIVVSAGTYTSVSFVGFHGGHISLKINDSETVTINGYIRATYSNDVLITCSGTGNLIINNNTSEGILLTRNSVLEIFNVVTTINMTNYYGIGIYDTSKFNAPVSVTINNATRAVNMHNLSSVYIKTFVGTGNTYAVYGASGAKISWVNRSISATNADVFTSGAQNTSIMSEILTSSNLGIVYTHVIMRSNGLCRYKLNGYSGTWTTDTAYLLGILPSVYRPSIILEKTLMIRANVQAYLYITTAGGIYIVPRTNTTNQTITIDETFLI